MQSYLVVKVGRHLSPAETDDLLLLAGAPDLLVEAGQRPGHRLRPHALLDAVGLGQEVVGVAPAPAEEELQQHVKL